MADLVVTQHTTPTTDDVSVRAVHFFTNENWRARNRRAHLRSRPYHYLLPESRCGTTNDKHSPRCLPPDEVHGSECGSPLYRQHVRSLICAVFIAATKSRGA